MEEQLIENGELNCIMLIAAEIFQKGCHRFAKAIKSRENNNNENVRIGCTQQLWQKDTKL
jgi:hypothetical protein